MNIVLLDADIIIDLHRLNLWKSLTKNNKIHISSIICREANYFDDTEGNRHFIDLAKEAGKTFIEISATLEQLARIAKEFEGLYEINLHSGKKRGARSPLDKKRNAFLHL